MMHSGGPVARLTLLVQGRGQMLVEGKRHDT